MVNKTYLAYPDDPNSWYVVHTCRKKPKYIYIFMNQIGGRFYKINYKTRTVQAIKKCKFCGKYLQIFLKKNFEPGVKSKKF